MNLKKEYTARLEQEKKDAVALEEKEKLKAIRNSFIIAFIGAFLIAVFIFRSYHLKQKANSIITAQKQEVERQKIAITDSINYALKIQESILPTALEIKQVFQESFILFKPKDIVSGDFYWLSSVSKTEHILVVADCTGHGVPGAFLSLIGSTLLNEIVNHRKIFDPSEIMNELAHGISETLVHKQDDKFTTEGMDISICMINTSTKKLLFAGANHCVYLCHNNVLEQINAQVSSINGIFGIQTTEKTKTIALNLKDSSLYLFSDGFADQRGGPAGKKIMSSNFKKIIEEINSFPMEEQKKELEDKFSKWKGNEQQIDDVLIIGIKV